MYGPAGHLYVYFVYGMHWCANIVTGADGTASAVLLRAGEVVDGLDAGPRSGGRRARRDVDLARGPAGLAAVLGLTGADTGADLCDPERSARRSEPGRGRPVAVAQGPRVGVSAAAGRALAVLSSRRPDGERLPSRHPGDPRRTGDVGLPDGLPGWAGVRCRCA